MAEQSSADGGTFMSCTGSRVRALLFAGVSTLALTVGATELRAADMSPAPRPVLKAPPPAVAPVLTMWIEGVAMFTGGSNMTGFNPVASDANIFGCKSDVCGAGPSFV